jgi:hypothetical protein
MSEDRPEGEEKGSAAAIVKEGTLNKTSDELYGYPAGITVERDTF